MKSYDYVQYAILINIYEPYAYVQFDTLMTTDASYDYIQLLFWY